RSTSPKHRIKIYGKGFDLRDGLFVKIVGISVVERCRIFLIDVFIASGGAKTADVIGSTASGGTVTFIGRLRGEVLHIRDFLFIAKFTDRSTAEIGGFFTSFFHGGSVGGCSFHIGPVVLTGG